MKKSIIELIFMVIVVSIAVALGGSMLYQFKKSPIKIEKVESHEIH